MGSVASCLRSFRVFSWLHPQLVNLEADTDVIETPKVYSWDNKRTDNSEFLVENLTDKTVYKYPGDINGNQFMIRNCQNSEIFLFDYMNTITLDDCKNCKIFIGPTKVRIL